MYFYQNFTSNNLQRYVVTTSGSYAFTNSTDWSDQLKQMHEKGISKLSDDDNKAVPINLINLFLVTYFTQGYYFRFQSSVN